MKLERLLLAYAREAGIVEHVEQRMEFARTLEGPGYSGWLKAQIDAAGR